MILKSQWVEYKAAEPKQPSRHCMYKVRHAFSATGSCSRAAHCCNLNPKANVVSARSDLRTDGIFFFFLFKTFCNCKVSKQRYCETWTSSDFYLKHAPVLDNKTISDRTSFREKTHQYISYSGQIFGWSYGRAQLLRISFWSVPQCMVTELRACMQGAH